MNLKLDDFLYDLPNNKIARQPANERGQSKLLFYDRGSISHHSFSMIEKLLPRESLLVFNDTKVIPARLILYKETGARIEIFLLEPIKPSSVHEEVMNEKKTCSWKCMIGNAKKWKITSRIMLSTFQFEVIRISENEVQFRWENGSSFSDLLTKIGKIPLPPYIDREVEEEDKARYQTVYSKMKGAVAAPTAGLHFSKEIIEKLNVSKIRTDFLTLHVSAGTFQPIKFEKIEEHPMHNEQVWISKGNIENLLNHKTAIAVGTTSMRTMESLYWYGVKLLQGEEKFFINKNDPYHLKKENRNKALTAILSHMDRHGVDKIGGKTEIFIYPGYEFQICDGLITNYHLPGSTLILLIAAFIGEDWRKVYEEALANDYRFLSYGDSSLLLKN